MRVAPARGRRRDAISGFPAARDAYGEYPYEWMSLSSPSTQPLIDHSVISECRYGDENQASGVVIFPSHDSSLPSISSQDSDIEYLSIHAVFTQNRIAGLHQATASYVLNFFTTNGQSVRNVAELFFRTVSSWSPMVHRKRLYHNLGIMSAIPRADVALLTLCMHLIYQVPIQQKQPIMMRDSTY